MFYGSTGSWVYAVGVAFAVFFKIISIVARGCHGGTFQSDNIIYLPQWHQGSRWQCARAALWGLSR